MHLVLGDFCSILFLISLKLGIDNSRYNKNRHKRKPYITCRAAWYTAKVDDGGTDRSISSPAAAIAPPYP